MIVYLINFGGVKRVDIIKKIAVLKCSWIRRLYDKSLMKALSWMEANPFELYPENVW